MTTPEELRRSNLRRGMRRSRESRWSRLCRCAIGVRAGGRWLSQKDEPGLSAAATACFDLDLGCK
jgi:hypothetical protein